jgi:hypothetical protein
MGRRTVDVARGRGGEMLKFVFKLAKLNGKYDIADRRMVKWTENPDRGEKKRE